MEDKLMAFNAPGMYLLAGIAISVVFAMCIFFLIKSWRAGVKLGMDKKVMRKAVISSATFTILPAVSILLGVVALSGNLGIPLPWLRLSVIGNLQYEVNVAEIAAKGIGLSGLKISEITNEAFVTIALVMTAGILAGAISCIFGLRPYTKKLSTATLKKSTGGSSKKSFGDHAMIAMFIGMCSAYIGSYVGSAVRLSNMLPILTALVAALVMTVCEILERKFKIKWLENFDLAFSMLIAMVSAVFMNMALA